MNPQYEKREKDGVLHHPASCLALSLLSLNLAVKEIAAFGNPRMRLCRTWREKERKRDGGEERRREKMSATATTNLQGETVKEQEMRVKGASTTVAPELVGKKDESERYVCCHSARLETATNVILISRGGGNS